MKRRDRQHTSARSLNEQRYPSAWTRLDKAATDQFFSARKRSSRQSNRMSFFMFRQFGVCDFYVEIISVCPLDETPSLMLQLSRHVLQSDAVLFVSSRRHQDFATNIQWPFGRADYAHSHYATVALWRMYR